MVIPCKWTVKHEQFGYVDGTLLVECDFKFERLVEGTYAFNVRTVSKRKRESWITVGFEDDCQLSFEIDNDLQIVEDSTKTRGFFRADRLHVELQGNTVHIEVEIQVRETTHSCIVTLDERTRFNRDKKLLPLPIPTNATAMTFEQFLGEQ